MLCRCATGARSLRDVGKVRSRKLRSGVVCQAQCSGQTGAGSAGAVGAGAGRRKVQSASSSSRRVNAGAPVQSRLAVNTAAGMLLLGPTGLLRPCDSRCERSAHGNVPTRGSTPAHDSVGTSIGSHVRFEGRHETTACPRLPIQKHILPTARDR